MIHPAVEDTDSIFFAKNIFILKPIYHLNFVQTIVWKQGLQTEGWFWKLILFVGTVIFTLFFQVTQIQKKFFSKSDAGFHTYLMQGIHKYAWNWNPTSPFWATS